MLENLSMQILQHLVFATICVLASAPNAMADEPIRLRVLSYNIHHAEGVDRKLDLDRIAGVITNVDPDLVALQEVDQNVKRTKSVDQPAELARLTKMNVVFGANIDLQGGQYGNAILSQFPIERHQNHLLPNLDQGEQRGVLEAEFRTPESNETITLLATHLDHRRDHRERIASAIAINQLVARNSDRPALLAGDLNAVFKSQTLAQIRTSWASVNLTPLPTIPVGQPAKQIDFILFRPESRWKTIEVKVIDESVASDHRAILAVLELLPSKDQ
jgi:endonuclease/exonuclease/phosphatase family metal-dependent hydrolase